MLETESGMAGPGYPDPERVGTRLGRTSVGLGGLSAEAGIGGLNWGFASGVGLVAGCTAIGGGGLRVVVRVVACLVPGGGGVGFGAGGGCPGRGYRCIRSGVRGYVGDGC